MKPIEKRNIAIVAGGYSGEREVSLKSQSGILHFLEQSGYQLHSVEINKEKWLVRRPDGSEQEIDKNDFSFTPDGGQKTHLDYAYITIHGTPGENGRLTGYLDMLGIPYSCCETLVGALTFNKYVCNRYLSTFGIETSPSMRLLRGRRVCAEELVEQLGLPLFIKPNDGGSSVATRRVDTVEELLPAVQDAFEEGEEVLVERLIVGTEVTCGAYQDATGVHVLPVTEVVSHNSFFDFDAKYNGQVDEITPARISQELFTTVQGLTRKVYEILPARGIIRVDFIIRDGHPVLLEVNTTPGMTQTSFIPQQVNAAGLTMREVLESVIEYQISQHQARL